jgi:hypothetical protein
MWFNLAAARGDSNAAKGRDLMASIMNPTQMEKAQALAAAWTPTTAQQLGGRLLRTCWGMTASTGSLVVHSHQSPG